MRLEKLTEKHLKECANIYIYTFNEPPWNDSWTDVTAYKRLEEIYKTPGFIGMLVMENDQVVAAVLGNLETWFEGYMYNLKEMFVKKTIKGKGTGSFLFSGLEEELKNHEVTSISLFTSRGDLTEKFYLKNGCLTEEDMIMMCKKL